MSIRQTRTYAELEISEAAHNEIAKLLRDAGYDFVFSVDDGGKVTIDMAGIGLTIKPAEQSPPATMPVWKSHKVVSADKIVKLIGGGEKRTVLELDCGVQVAVETAEYRKRVPADREMRGGYYVRYEDGYESWSPAEVFEEVYTRVEPAFDLAALQELRKESP